MSGGTLPWSSPSQTACTVRPSQQIVGENPANGVAGGTSTRSSWARKFGTNAGPSPPPPPPPPPPPASPPPPPPPHPTATRSTRPAAYLGSARYGRGMAAPRGRRKVPKDGLGIDGHPP